MFKLIFASFYIDKMLNTQYAICNLVKGAKTRSTTFINMHLQRIYFMIYTDLYCAIMEYHSDEYF